MFLSSGSDDKLKAIELIINDVFEVCKKSEMLKSYMEQFFYLEILESAKKTVRLMEEQAPTKILEYFNTEEKMLIYLNPFLLHSMTSVYLKHGTDILLKSSSIIPILVNLHLAYAIYF